MLFIKPSEIKTKVLTALAALLIGGVVAGKYHVYAYTMLDINVTGEGNAVDETEDDWNTFKLEGDEEPN